MADPKKPAPSGTGTPLIAGGKKFWFLVFAIIGILALYHYGKGIGGAITRSAGEAGSHSVTTVGGTTDITGGPPAVTVIKVKVDPNNWSNWIYLPVNCKFQVDRPGWIEYKFLDGHHQRFADGTTKWLGTISSNTFQLRGEAGEVTISYTLN